MCRFRFGLPFGIATAVLAMYGGIIAEETHRPRIGGIGANRDGASRLLNPVRGSFHLSEVVTVEFVSGIKPPSWHCQFRISKPLQSIRGWLGAPNYPQALAVTPG